jgi:hypothetical protein
VTSLAASRHVRRAVVYVSAGINHDPGATPGSLEAVEYLSLHRDLEAIYQDAGHHASHPLLAFPSSASAFWLCFCVRPSVLPCFTRRPAAPRSAAWRATCANAARELGFQLVPATGT